MKLIWIFISYLSGALPLSVWIGRLAGHDIRRYGDGNPGATNVLRAAGRPWFIGAMLADVGKAALPVGLAAYIFGWSGWEMLPIALAPSIGHAFSIFLGGKGGKALASILGTWIGLTLWELPFVLLPQLVFWFALLAVDGWAVILTAVGGALYLLLFNPQPIFLAVMLGQVLLVAWTHRRDLARRPRLRRRGGTRR